MSFIHRRLSGSRALLCSFLPMVAVVAGCGDDPAAADPGTAPDGGAEAGSDASPDTEAPDAETPEADTPDADAATGKGVGGACYTDAECAAPAVCWSADGEGLPGGYCLIEGCTQGSCPDGSDCFEFNDGVSRCLATCQSNDECRVSEGYVCDDSQTCWPGTGTVPPGGSCGSADQCMGGANAYCITQPGWVGGFCVIIDCTATSCPDGSACRQVFTDGSSGCVPLCEGPEDCRDGYTCVDAVTSKWVGACRAGCDTDDGCPGDYGCREGLCVDVSNECGPLNANGDCPAGQVCNAGTCEPFECNDTVMEPNDTQAAAVDLPATSTGGLQICSGDEDWFTFTPETPDTLYLVGIDSNWASGNLQVDLADAAGEVHGDASMEPALYNSENPVGPTNFEAHAMVGAAGADPAWLHVYGEAGAVNNYGLEVRQIAYQDGASCTDLFDPSDCAATTGTGKHDPSKLLIFPASHGADPYIGDGVFFKNGLAAFGNPPYTPTSRLWARREVIMILRHAIHSVQEAFPGTAPLGIGDIGMPDGTTPEGHPNGTHYDGANADIAYYIRPDVQGTDGNLPYRQICCDAPLNNWNCVDTSTTSAGYGTCKPGNEHIVDVPRTSMMIAKIAGSGRLRVIGVEAKVEADINAGLDDLVTQGLITSSERSAAKAHIATANDDSSWIWHFNHMHASFLEAAPTAPASNATSADGFEGPWPGMSREEQQARARAFRPAGR